MPHRRTTDHITDAMVDEIANNGHTTKQLIARMHLENKVEHKEIFTMLRFHGWFIKISIGTLVTASVGLLSALIIWAIRCSLGG